MNMKRKITGYPERAKYYDLEFNSIEDKEIINYFLSLGVKRVLEIPCGSGRNLDWLAKTEKETIFADLSPEMVAIVNLKIKNLSFNHRAVAVCADIVSYADEKKFDLILVPREAIQLLSPDDLSKAVLNLKNNLSDNGILYLDFAVLDVNLISDRRNLPKYIRDQGGYYSLDIDYNSESLSFKRWHKSIFGDGKLNVDFRYEILDGKEELKYSSSIDLISYDYDCLWELFKKIGLSKIKVYGDYDMKPYDSKSGRMIFILKKTS